MDRETFEALPTVAENVPEVSISDVGPHDRTLLYGYSIDRHSWHVYVQGGEIHLCVYASDGWVEEHTAAETWPARNLIPDKRVYPHATEAGFARLLLSRGVSIPFTTFRDDNADWTGFYPLAKTADDLYAEGSCIRPNGR